MQEFGGWVQESPVGGWGLCQLQVVLSRLEVSALSGLILICGARQVPPGSRMTTKIIHFMVNGRLEKAEFESSCSAAEVKGKTRGPGA